jgi:hypothetical protein
VCMNLEAEIAEQEQLEISHDSRVMIL